MPRRQVERRAIHEQIPIGVSPSDNLLWIGANGEVRSTRSSYIASPMDYQNVPLFSHDF